MTTPAAVNQRVQHGTESEAGTAVAAGRAFRASTVTVGPKIEVEKLRPAGSRFASTTYIKKESTEGKLEGVPCWNELPTILTWALGDAVDTDTGDTVDHVWTGVGEGDTRTLEVGDSENAAQVPGAFIKSLELSWGRNSGEAKLTAALVGQQWTDGHTLTPGVTASAVRPIEASTVDVYLDSSAAALGTTLVADAVKVSLKTGELRAPVWHLNSAKPSFADRVSTPAEDAEISLLASASAAARNLLGNLRAGDVKYLRIKSTGPLVDGTTEPHVLTIDAAVKVADHSRDETDNVWTVESTFAIVEDEDGFSIAVTLTDGNATAA